MDTRGVEMKNCHGHEIVVNADKEDYGRKWGVAPKESTGCWCYDCTMKRQGEWVDEAKYPFKKKEELK
jgi:hypothetical protein